MRKTDLKEVTGKVVRGWYKWLCEQDMGCCSIWYESTDKYRYCVCVGWHNLGDGPKEKNYDHWVVAWKIGRQTHNNVMQCDFDVDFEMPFVTEEMAKADKSLCEGDVDNTIEEVECEKIVYNPYKCWGKTWHPWRWSTPKGYRDWNALAAYMRKQARRVYRDWRDHDD